MTPTAFFRTSGSDQTSPPSCEYQEGTVYGFLRRGGYSGTGGAQRIIVREEIGISVSGLPALDPIPAASALRKIRRISGLTLEELAIVFAVCRRTLHLWDAGKVMPRQGRLRKLYEVLGMMERLDRGNPIQLRNLLLMELDGLSPLKMLRTGRGKRVEELLKQKLPAASMRLVELPEAEFKKRLPEGVGSFPYAQEQNIKIVSGRPMKGFKTPRLRKP